VRSGPEQCLNFYWPLGILRSVKYHYEHGSDSSVPDRLDRGDFTFSNAFSLLGCNRGQRQLSQPQCKISAPPALCNGRQRSLLLEFGKAEGSGAALSPTWGRAPRVESRQSQTTGQVGRRISAGKGGSRGSICSRSPRDAGSLPQPTTSTR
jgi:hypothetical protein